MVKTCKVLLNNEAITVFDYDGIKVQVPSIHRETRTIRVLAKNGIYSVVDDNYIEPDIPFMGIAETINKETTLNENANETEEESE